jgi:hypothetical protein
VQNVMGRFVILFFFRTLSVIVPPPLIMEWSSRSSGTSPVQKNKKSDDRWKLSSKQVKISYHMITFPWSKKCSLYKASTQYWLPASTKKSGDLSFSALLVSHSVLANKLFYFYFFFFPTRIKGKKWLHANLWCFILLFYFLLELA